MNNRFRYLWPALLLLILGGSAAMAMAQKIVIKGSDTLGAKLMPILAEEFKAHHPRVSFEIAAEGSTTGIAAIIHGTANIGMSSRDVTLTEISAAKMKGFEIRQHVVGYDGVAVIVHESNPVDGLRRSQVEQIFTGVVTNWAAVGGLPQPISVYTRNTASGTYSDFKMLVMRKRDYLPDARIMAGNEQIASQVAGNPAGIGYVGLIYADTPGAKVLQIDGLSPDSVHSGHSDYILSRPTYLYTNGQATGVVGEFIDFVLGPPGQEIVAREGFVAIR